MRDLLPALIALADVDVFIDDYAHDATSVPAPCGVYPHREFLVRRADAPYDCVIYHLGNSPFHRYLYPYAARFPGVAVLHDHVLHHLLAGMAEEGGSGFYFREMAYNAGTTGVRAAWEALMTHTEVPFYQYPLNRRILDVSLGIAVHSDYLRTLIEKEAPEGPVARIPMGMPLPTVDGDPLALRAVLRIPPARFVVGSFGQATAQKRIPQVLQAVAGLASRGADIHYLIVGSVGAELDVLTTVERLGLQGRVTVTGYVDETTFNACLQAVNVCVNLRYPTAGETSAAALRCMAAGRPTIVTGVGANLEFADEACLKLPAGPQEVPMLERVLQALLDAPEARQHLGRGARAYVQREHSLAAAASGMASFVERCLSPGQLGAEKETYSPSPLLKEVAERLNSVGVTAQEVPLMADLARALVFVDGTTDHSTALSGAAL